MSWYEATALDPGHPEGVVIECMEQGADALLLAESALPPAFFDLSSGVLGAMAHKASVYRIRVALVVADQSGYSESFSAAVREANRGRLMHFSPTREDALAWCRGVADHSRTGD